MTCVRYAVPLFVLAGCSAHPPMPDAGCVESDLAFCASFGSSCGPVTGLDRCGQARSVDCGQCSSSLVCSQGLCREPGALTGGGAAGTGGGSAGGGVAGATGGGSTATGGGLGAVGGGHGDGGQLDAGADLCAAKECVVAPAPSCASASSRWVFTTPGACKVKTGQCAYESREETCASGLHCEQGQCVAAPSCDASTCAGCCLGAVCVTVTTQNGATCGSAGAACQACSSGFSCQAGACADVNECATGNGGCDANASCSNTSGGRTCACKAGFQGDGVTCKALVTLTVDTGSMAPQYRTGSQTWVIIGENRLVKQAPANGFVSFTDSSLAGPQDITLVHQEATSTQVVTVTDFTGHAFVYAPYQPSRSYTTATLSGAVTGWSNFNGLRVWATAPDSGGGTGSQSGSSFSLSVSVPVGTTSLDVFATEFDSAGKLARTALKRNVAPSSSVSLPLVATSSDYVVVNNLGLYEGTKQVYETYRNGTSSLFNTEVTTAVPGSWNLLHAPSASVEYSGLSKDVSAYTSSSDGCLSGCASSHTVTDPSNEVTTLDLLPPMTLVGPKLGSQTAAPTASLATLSIAWNASTGQYQRASMYATSSTTSFSWDFYSPATRNSVKPFTLPGGLPALPQGLWYLNVSSFWNTGFVSFDALFSAGRTGWSGTSERSMYYGGYVNLY